MAAHEHLSGQFEDLIFPGVRHGQGEVTYRGTVPVVAQGFQRLWRSSSIQKPAGWWSNHPLTSYGTRMMYMDVPHAVAEEHRVKGGWPHKEGPPDPRRPNEYLFGRDSSGRSVPLPADVHHVAYHSEKPYEHSDFREYRKRWAE